MTNPILSMIKRIEFVSVGEVDVVFEINGKLFKRRALVNCSMTTFTMKVDAFWTPKPPEPVDTPLEEGGGNMSKDWPFGDLQRAGFKAIMADPPWYFRTRTTVVSDRDPQQHYGVMSAKDICALPVRELADKDSHLFLWATGPCLPQAFAVIDAWGFRFSGVAFTWIKLKRSYNADQFRILPSAESDLHVGLGFTTRKNAEFCLLARRGNAKRVAKDVREIIMSPVREHSRKPDEAFDRVRRYCAGPYLELFSRENREGWETWGNQVGKFDEAAA